MPDAYRHSMTGQSMTRQGSGLLTTFQVFEAMGRIPECEQEARYRRLLERRRKSPTWRAFAAEGPSRRRRQSE